MAATLPLVIDRIGITVGVSSKTHYGFLISQLYGMRDIQDDLLLEGNLKITKGKYFTRLDFWPEKKRKIAELICGSTKSSYLYFKLVLYPSCFRLNEFETIKSLTKTLLADWSYDDLFFTGHVSYIEIARDFLNKDFSDHLPHYPNAQKSKIYIDKKGIKGSKYIGAVSSSKRYCVYDKAKQLLEKKGGSNFKKLIRIEARRRKTGMKPFELLEGLGNPFKGLQMLSIQKLTSCSSDDAWKAFVDQCQHVGTALALGACDQQTKKIFESRIASASVEWWDASKAWDGWPSAFAAILP